MSKLSKIKKRNIALGAEEEPVVEPSTDPIEEPVNEDPVDPEDPEEEEEEVKKPNPKPNKGWVYPGYVPTRGEENSWYDPDEEVRPRVYHKYAKEDVYKTLYPDLLEKEEEEEPTDPETPVDPVDPTDPETPVDPSEPTDPVEPSDPEVPAEPSEPTDPENLGDLPVEEP